MWAQGLVSRDEYDQAYRKVEVEAHVEVDEADIASVGLGQPAAVTVDALPGRICEGVVTEIGNSSIRDDMSGLQAVNPRVVVTVAGDVPGVRPAFTATADITTATRTGVVAVPIRSTVMREVDLARARDPCAPRRSRRGALCAGSRVRIGG